MDTKLMVPYFAIFAVIVMKQSNELHNLEIKINMCHTRNAPFLENFFIHSWAKFDPMKEEVTSGIIYQPICKIDDMRWLVTTKYHDESHGIDLHTGFP